MTDRIDTVELFRCLGALSDLFPQIGFARTKPITGGVFGASGYVLCSCGVVEQGLDAIHYFVVHSDSGAVVGHGFTKPDVLATARLALQTVELHQWTLFFGRRLAMRAEVASERELLQRQAINDRADSPKVRSIPRRRRQIFDAEGGLCHYCGATLVLDGRWHIEHKMPKALGGGNEPGNLVASCVACNVKKRDTTDIEFKARIARERT